MPVATEALSSLFAKVRSTELARAVVKPSEKAIGSAATMVPDTFVRSTTGTVEASTIKLISDGDPAIKQINARQEQICAKYGPFNNYGIGMRSPSIQAEQNMKQDLKNLLYRQIFPTEALIDTSDSIVSFWANSTSPQQGSLRTAWEAVAQGHEPQSDTEKQLFDLYQSRSDRWQKLAKLTGSVPPTSFHLFRGVGSDQFVQDVINAWQDTSKQTMSVRHYSLSSWSLKPDIAEEFARFGRGQEAPAAVVFEADVPFEHTLLDKWADGSTFVTRYPGQDEVVVATPKPNSLEIPKEKATVFLNGVRYGYADREALFKAWSQKSAEKAA